MQTCPECGESFEFSEDNVIKKDYISDTKIQNTKTHKSTTSRNLSNSSNGYPAIATTIILLNISFWFLSIIQTILIVYGIVYGLFIVKDIRYIIIVSLISLATFFTISIPILAFSELLKIIRNIEKNTKRQS